MLLDNLQPVAPSKLHTRILPNNAAWLWEGYLKPSSISLLVSDPKSGKTTLLSGILEKFGTGEPFLDRAVRPAKVLVFSEESEEIWLNRHTRRPLGDHIRFFFRPFFGEPTLEDWAEMLNIAREMRSKIGLDLLVIDTMAAHLPVYCDLNAKILSEMIRLTRDFTRDGPAVLFLHHPRRAKSDEGMSARGSMLLLGFVDIIIELKCLYKNHGAGNVRALSVRSRNAVVRTQQLYEWNATTGEFRTIADADRKECELIWPEIEGVLMDHPHGLNAAELLGYLHQSDRPLKKSLLYQWLREALKDRRIVRRGEGHRYDPYFYKLRDFSPSEHAEEYVI